MDIRDVECCYLLETRLSVNNRGVTISRAYVTVYSGVELKCLNILKLRYFIIILLLIVP